MTGRHVDPRDLMWICKPQLYLQKSEGFRYVEHKAKVGCLYYFGAEPFEYCVQNIRAQERPTTPSSTRRSPPPAVSTFLTPLFSAWFGCS